MATLYDELGVDSAVTADELRRAYYRRARELHPDVNPTSESAEGMRRLNAAWAVLGNAERRRRYDLQLAKPTSTAPIRQPPVADTGVAEPDVPLGPQLLARLLRPSALILAVLMVIFVVTAYAGQAGHGSRPTTTTTATGPDSAPTTLPSGPLPDPMGNCVLRQPGFDAMVPCSQPNSGMVVALVATSAQCPPQTTAYQLAGRAQWVCLEAVNGTAPPAP